MYSKFKAVAAILLMAAVVLLSPATPAAAAAPAAVFVWNGASGDCLDQHYNGNQPTTTASAWYECHYFGNQQWTFVTVDTNAYWLVNARSGWCLSAPNGAGSQVYAEVCSRPIPNKQIWVPSSAPDGGHIMINRLSGQCLVEAPDYKVFVAKCDSKAGVQRWYWG
ncbi:RICIN domain-containing protein [Paractinoplanes lichenicola]|uniref:RICIN domain-containing protein n=1 Tax=Paractinoplanes lichenicola TaxID=2802976 RepID=A0ABS1VGY8_9ACTN|nr:RICIN domain-containing protein [Actinoplanes lichenicola]MBL7253895.1 RICIN domain-containing protein [Actinoplanes lichenicola]